MCSEQITLFNYKLPNIDFEGTWRAVDQRTLWFKLNDFETECTLKFIDDFGEEAVLLEPARDPPSRMTLV